MSEGEIWAGRERVDGEEYRGRGGVVAAKGAGVDRALPAMSERVRRHRWAIVTGAGALVAMLALSSTGLPSDLAILGPAAALERLLSAGLAAALYLFACWGYGRPFMRLLPPASSGGWVPGARGIVQGCVGFAVMLWLVHALGVAGLLSGWVGQPVGVVVLCIGVALGVTQVVRGVRTRSSLPAAGWTWMLALPAIAVLVLASLSPPGYLWRSEAFGYDVLSYHAQLPIEWARGEPAGAGRLWPLQHNVYSFLPGAMEALFLHVHAMLGGGLAKLASPVTGGSAGLLAHEGWGLVVCQLIHAGTALMAAAGASALVRMVIARLRGTVEEGAAEAMAGGLAGAMVLATPWVVVTGSMMYNEAAVLALSVAALVVCAVQGAGAWQRGLVVGALIGAACACKPTALFLCGPVAGAGLLLSVWCDAEPARRWRAVVLAALAGCAGGVLTFGPPLLRNWAAAGNPIFPAVMGVFGLGHWTAEQAARFASGHTKGPGLVEGLRLLVSMAPDGASVDAQARGVWHVQWAGMWVVGMAGLLCASVLGRGMVRWAGVIGLAGVLVAAVWWAGFSHAQSRFLVPLVGVLAAGAGMTMWLCVRQGAAAGMRLGAVVCAGGVLMGSVMTVRLYQGAANGAPTMLMVLGLNTLTGENAREQLAHVRSAGEAQEIVEQLSPPAYVNVMLQQGEAVMLIGGATPLYMLWPTAYQTTWDTRELGDAISTRGDDPSQWTAALQREARRQLGREVTHVMIDFGEVQRLRASGWYDPRVTEGALRRWMSAEAEPVKLWRDERGTPTHALVRLLGAPVMVKPTTKT